MNTHTRTRARALLADACDQMVESTHSNTHAHVPNRYNEMVEMNYLLLKRLQALEQQFQVHSCGCV